MVRSSSKISVRRRRSRAPQLEVLERRELLAQIPVTTLADAGAGSLRAAIERANLEPGPDSITFPAVAGTITLASALPNLASDLTLIGPGALSLTIARATDPGTPEFRILTIPEGASVSLSGLTLSHGRIVGSGAGLSNAGTASLTGVAITGNSLSTGTGGGAGLFNSGTISLEEVTVANNVVNSIDPYRSLGGAGIANTGRMTILHSNIRNNVENNPSHPGGGGGIANSGNLAVNESVIRGNQGFERGGGVQNSGTLTIRGSLIEGNTAGGVPIESYPMLAYRGAGGGISNDGTLTIVESTIRANAAKESFDQTASTPVFWTHSSGRGGGIANQGALRIVRSSITENQVPGDSGRGGGLTSGGTAEISDTTFSGNVSDSGSAIEIWGSGHLSVVGSTLTADSGRVAVVCSWSFPWEPESALTVASSILSNSGGVSLVVSRGVFQSQGHNLFSDRPEVALDATDQTGVDPLLGPLADNGGPTWTRALLPGSPAINAGGSDPALATDQRGVVRPQGLRPDIGAFEAVLVAPEVTSLQRFGYHWQPTTLIVAFDAAMDPARATNLANYTLVQLGPGGRQRSIRLASAQVSDAAQTVALRPMRRLAVRGRYQLTVRGRGPDGLASRDGQLLDGAGTGEAGTDFVTRFGREALQLPARPDVVRWIRPALRVRGSGLRGAAGS